MNPNIQQVNQNQDLSQVQGAFSCWAGAEILAGLIYRRRNELRLERTQSQTTTTQTTSFEIPDSEMIELSRDATRASQHYFREYLSVYQEQSNTQTPQRKAG